MFTECGKSWDDEGETKYNNQKPQRNLIHITCSDCRRKGYMGVKIIDLHRQNSNRKQKHSEKMKQEKSEKNPYDEGEQNKLVNVKDE